ncbi:MAG: hypothetical protein P8N52_03470 [Crocinitomicaceae bacterium]|nr:hypothetical protein [Crocinitomicaceae bacterium]MDG1777266.1 hypothetical protein [Crocinitomicaceae bacterium]
MKATILIGLMLMGVSMIHAQECEKVLFTGKVSDTLRPQSFYNLMVVNRSNGKGVFGQPDGSFSVYVNQGDLLSLSVKGYPVVSVVVHGDADCQHETIFYIEGKIQEFEVVNVKPLKSLAQIKEERQALAMRETRMVTGIDVLQSPITALYQAFSKKEQSKRWVAKQEHLDNQQHILQELLRTYAAYDIIELTDDEFKSFISFLNMDEMFLKTASEMELITFVKDKFEHYQQLIK